MNRRHFLSQSLAFAGMATSLFPCLASAQTSEAQILFAQSYPDLNGTDQPLQNWRGRPVVMNFWATWCPPCVKEMPDLEALNQKYPDIAFVGLGVDTAANMRNFLPKVQVTYDLLVVGYGGIELMKQLGNTAGGLPFTLVFNEKGRMVKRILGQVKPETLDEVLARL
ncbi:MAG: thioredoxin [Pusillimonas sp.]|jgi:thiol-disulfide isomerase/thioredoxin|nr:thioredoxin [Pusillimonas sp.]|tara:strand:+ start:121090 stop:121590 length:501 start_codon:yes stop_codon:yes gene_type:complete